MRYIWVTITIFVIWSVAVLLAVFSRIPNPETFFLFLVITTVILASIGFKSA